MYGDLLWSKMSPTNWFKKKLCRDVLLEKCCKPMNHQVTKFSIHWKKVKNIWDALGDLVPFLQFKKREKHPASICNFTKSIILYFKSRKASQIFLSAISGSYLSNGFHCYYKSGQIHFKSGQLLLLQIGATVITKSGQGLRIGPDLLLEGSA